MLLGQIYIHATFGKVCRIQETIALNESARQTRVTGSVGSLDHGHGLRGRRRGTLSHSDSRIPSGNRSINRGEEERRRLAWSQQEICWTAICDCAGGCTQWCVLVIWIGLRNGDDQGLLGSGAVVERAESRRVVRNPPHAAGTPRQTPRIDQLRIGNRGYSRRVRNQVGLPVVLRKANGLHSENQECTGGET